MAQSKAETGNFTSNVYLTDHNLFGMKVNSRPNETPGLMSPEGNRYAHYSSDSKSVKDYLQYLQQVNFPMAVNGSDQFVSSLQSRGYFTAGYLNYLTNLNRYLS